MTRRKMLDGFRYTWRSFFGKPDGHWPRLYCWLRGGHLYETCRDDCCDGRVTWCVRCHTNYIWPEQLPTEDVWP